MKRYVALSGILLMTFVSGCMYELRDEMTECKINWSNTWAARAAWCDARSSCEGISCPHSFKDGFTAGYIAVANGGSGCTPAVPQIPCCNHMWLDFCCSENDKMESWFDGYEIGATFAKSEGMGDSNRINTRIPRSTPVDFSNSSNSSTMPMQQEAPESPVPPTPIRDSDAPAGPQTRRDLKQFLE